MDFGTLVPEVLRGHPAVRSVALTGSCARGSATPLSDWDFAVESKDFETVAEALPSLKRRLGVRVSRQLRDEILPALR